MAEDRVEVAAALLHNEWCAAAHAFERHVNVPPRRKEYWGTMCKPYDELSEDLQAATRSWAEEFLAALDAGVAGEAEEG